MAFQCHIHTQFISVAQNSSSLLLFMMLPLLQAEKWPCFCWWDSPHAVPAVCKEFARKRWVFPALWGAGGSHCLGSLQLICWFFCQGQLSERIRNKSAFSKTKIKAVVSNLKECKNKSPAGEMGRADLLLLSSRCTMPVNTIYIYLNISILSHKFMWHTPLSILFQSICVMVVILKNELHLKLII